METLDYGALYISDPFDPPTLGQRPALRCCVAGTATADKDIFSVTPPIVSGDIQSPNWTRCYDELAEWTFRIEGKTYKLTGAEVARIVRLLAIEKGEPIQQL